MLAERLREVVEGIEVEVEGKGTARVTASVGVAELGKGIPDGDALIAAAVEALGLAQRDGRNRVVFV
jgi:PleD family two-component response regulator